MDTFFDKNGFLNLDDAVQDVASFKKIMADGIVTDVELAEQADCVSSLLHQVEAQCSPQQLSLIKELLVEMNVLFTVYHYKELQSLK